MKNFINYYYGIFVTEVRKNNDLFYIKSNDDSFIFKPLLYDVNIFYNTYSVLQNLNIPYFKIVKNSTGNLITNYHQNAYVLLKENIISNDDITVEKIFKYDIIVSDGNKALNWKKMWKEKMDYYEYQMNQIGYKYKAIKDSINYYFGLCECAINILNYVENNNFNICICHRRINLKDNFEFYDPTNLILDNITRDISEYIKEAFIHEVLTYDEILNIINKINFTQNEAILLISRMLYPSYFFDIYDKVINNQIDQSKIDFIIKKNNSYELFLKNIYKFLKLKYKLPEIEWLN